MELPTLKDFDITDNCINSIDKEVWKGAKVRDEKLKTNQSNPIYQYDLVDIDFNEPSCSKSYGSRHITSQLQRLKRRSHRSLSPQKRKKKFKKLKKHKHNEGKNTCGMRIAELAVPSKRHCIETWRSNWDTLPILMLDRLRQIVMDQKPIVPIQDAIICFKQKQTHMSRSPSKGNKTIKNKKNKEIKLLCGIFGFRISAELQAPRNVTLGTRLKPISHVVNDEISRLLAKRKISNLQKNIQLEIASKITNWIADILEQSTYNLMLEDYIELEKEEGHIWDLIDELVDNAALLCKGLSTSSSDVIDESSDLHTSLIDEDTTGSSGSDSSDDTNLAEFRNIISNIIEKVIHTQDIDNISGEILDDIEEYSSKTLPESIENYFKNFLFNYIDDVIFNDVEKFEDALHFDVSDSNIINDFIPNIETQSTVKENSDEEIIGTNNELNIRNDLHQNKDIFENALVNGFLKNEALDESSSVNNNLNSNDLMEHSFSPENIPKDLSLLQDNEDKIAVNMNNELNNINNEIGQINLETDETMPLMDITSDNSIKKVKYSNIYMDSEQGQLNMKSNIRDGDSRKTGTQGIHFALPNDNLLSNADESWPENLSFPTVKATVSISKSILSLGKINEDDEKTKNHNSVNEDDIIENNVEFNDEKVTKSIDEKLTKNDSLTEDVVETSNVESDRDIDKNMELLNIDCSIENIIDENLGHNDSRSEIKDILKTNNVEKSSEIASKITSKVLLEGSKSNDQVIDKKNKNILQASQEVGSSAELKDKAIETIYINNIKRPVNLSVKQMSVTSISPEIYPQNLQCLGPSKRNEITQTKPAEYSQCQESEVRIWCQGLQNVVQNLDMWLNWIDNTCSNLLHLKQKEKFLKCNRKIEKHDIRKWITLKTNVDSDSRLWEKLSISLQVGLRSYQRFYNQNEVSLISEYLNVIFLNENRSSWVASLNVVFREESKDVIKYFIFYVLKRT